MGLTQSRYSDNDFELAIRAAKDLEHILETEFNATGKGLHEKVTSASETGQLPNSLVKRMRYLATLRNQLVHKHGFDSIPNRQSFIQAFETSRKELTEIIEERRRRDGRQGGRGGGGLLLSLCSAILEVAYELGSENERKK